MSFIFCQTPGDRNGKRVFKCQPTWTLFPNLWWGEVQHNNHHVWMDKAFVLSYVTYQNTRGYKLLLWHRHRVLIRRNQSKENISSVDLFLNNRFLFILSLKKSFKYCFYKNPFTVTFYMPVLSVFPFCVEFCWIVSIKWNVHFTVNYRFLRSSLCNRSKLFKGFRNTITSGQFSVFTWPPSVASTVGMGRFIDLHWCISIKVNDAMLPSEAPFQGIKAHLNTAFALLSISVSAYV